MEIGGSAVQVRLKANPGHGVIVPNGAVKIEGRIDLLAVFHVQPDPQLSEGLYERLADRAALGFQVQDALVSGASRPYSPEAKRGMPSIDSQTADRFPGGFGRSFALKHSHSSMCRSSYRRRVLKLTLRPLLREGDSAAPDSENR